MKDMSYRDKMIILIISIIVILVAGFFALIRPKYQKLVANTATYEATKTEWDGIKQKLDAIPTLEDTITQAYQTASKDAGVLVNTAWGDYKDSLATEHVHYLVDEYLQPSLDESSITVEEVAMGTCGALNMEYYYYTPNVLTYALIEAADINGNYAEKASDALQVSAILEEHETAELLGQNVAMRVLADREGLMAFLDAIKSDKNAINVEAVKIADYTFNGGLEEEPQTQIVTRTEVDEEGNEVEVQEEVTTGGGTTGEEGTGYSEVELSITFFNAKEIDNPDFGD